MDDVLTEATDADEDVLVRGLDELSQQRIVREQGQEAYDFSDASCARWSTRV